jgi:hypothetical protein
VHTIKSVRLTDGGQNHARENLVPMPGSFCHSGNHSTCMFGV